MREGDLVWGAASLWNRFQTWSPYRLRPSLLLFHMGASKEDTCYRLPYGQASVLPNISLLLPKLTLLTPLPTHREESDPRGVWGVG